ncbi:hypothetical protein [Pseudoroseicyclus tamaricis]|uniref:Lipoprotein n=1 Tax=Pseudoroseicyclus tamaricis TaxID=2705421 RepID=A0A6B2JX77_9RHOB|nr:hypothetical protein [Pseudoroseicyclus tamaricis]NDV02730.1 hypothetical protein [Pseudoroseicyclus tamaricis]
MRETFLSLCRAPALALGTTLMLTACVAIAPPPPPAPPVPELPPEPGSQLPPEVRSIVAPGQDLTTAYLRPTDNCYWYSYTGPVETTELPLRSINDNPICLGAGSAIPAPPPPAA